MPPRLARLLAVLVAVALVAGAFVLRGALADEDEPTTNGPGTTTGAGGGDDGDGGPYRLLCDADLGEEACTAVAEATGAEVRTVTAGEVLADGGAAAEDADLWLTLDPLPGVLATVRAEADLGAITGEEPAPVASSPLAVLTFDGSPFDCLEPIAWACLVEPVRPEVAVPGLDSSLGIVVAAAGSAGLVGSTDLNITTFRDTEEADLVDDLISESPSAAGDTAADQANAMLRPGSASAVVTVEGLAERQASTVQGGNRGLSTASLFPPVTVGVVLAGLGPEGDAAVRASSEAVSGQTVLLALVEGGWTGAASASTGLPAADLVYALRERMG
ncbi:hypothetical protein HC251_14345 [Iamia sp. SCSIO 61187]|uniref:hypothetical protein n=1 Tax=Iamia sp. SCSIO 61187 TaxID=2722752 RepID=UPI001C635F65|nr:hypothetical protein [Iamia sp. SCSIO 61187]QYG93487.1 hypothetical protein HC251_14345 [Iamia sp. SCSIO 61187]